MFQILFQSFLNELSTQYISTAMALVWLALQHLESKPKLMCRPAVGVADLSFSKDEH